jgi:hypothetical protein
MNCTMMYGSANINFRRYFSVVSLIVTGLELDLKYLAVHEVLVLTAQTILSNRAVIYLTQLWNIDEKRKDSAD